MNDRMKNLAVRTVSGGLLAAVVVGAVVWTQWSLGALLLVLLAGGLAEFYALAARDDVRPQRAVGLVMGAGVAYYLLFVLAGWLFIQAVFFTVKLM